MPVTNLKVLRVQSGLRAFEVAEKIGLSAVSYCQRENGRVRISAREAVHLSRLFGVPVERIIGEVEDE